MTGVLVCGAAPLYIQVIDPATDTFGQRTIKGLQTTGVGFDAFLGPLGGGIRGIYWVIALALASTATIGAYAWFTKFRGTKSSASTSVRIWIAGALLLVVSGFAVVAGPLRAVPMWMVTRNGNAVLLVIGAGLLALAWSERSRLLAVVSVAYLLVSALCIFYSPENQLFSVLSAFGVSDADMPIGQAGALQVLLPGVVLLTGATIAVLRDLHAEPSAG